MRTAKIFLSVVLVLTTLGGCAGEDDSDIAPAASSKRDETLVPVSLEQDQKPLFRAEPPADGLIWRHFPLSRANTKALKCWLQDGVLSDQNQAIGESIFWGGALGLVVRLSGRPLLGRWKKEGEPFHPESPTSPHDDYWLWHKIEKNVKSPFVGVLQGAGMGLGCQLLLTGWSPINFPGLLGANYESASSALFLGGMSAFAASPLVRRMVGEAKPEEWTPRTAGDSETPEPPAGWLGKVSDAFHSSGAGKVLRYKITPAISVIFIGSGIAIWSYNDLQDRSENPPPSGDECERIRKTKSNETYQLAVPAKPRADR